MKTFKNVKILRLTLSVSRDKMIDKVIAVFALNKFIWNKHFQLVEYRELN